MLCFCSPKLLLSVFLPAVIEALAQLGPGSFEPAEWATFPRGTQLLDEIAATIASGRHLERIQVTLGARDLAFLEGKPRPSFRKETTVDPVFGGVEVPVEALFGGRKTRARRERPSTATAAVELAHRWTHGEVLLVVESGRVARRVRERSAIEACVLEDAATHHFFTTKKDRQSSTDLVVVCDPSSARGGPVVTLLQTLAAKVHGLKTKTSTVAMLLLNPDLRLPHPLAPGATMKPSLLTDFTKLYAAEADALDVGDDNGVSLYMRWPQPSYRLFERHNYDNFSFLGTAPTRPTNSQLKAVYHALIDDDDQ